MVTWFCPGDQQVWGDLCQATSMHGSVTECVTLSLYKSRFRGPTATGKVTPPILAHIEDRWNLWTQPSLELFVPINFPFHGRSHFWLLCRKTAVSKFKTAVLRKTTQNPERLWKGKLIGSKSSIKEGAVKNGQNGVFFGEKIDPHIFCWKLHL